MKKPSTILVVFLILSIGNLFASWQLPVTNFQQQDYASGTQSWQIRQQKNGWIYFANNYGLLEYDGYRWNTYGVWSGTTVRSVEIAEDGVIFVGSSNEYGKFTVNDLGRLSYTPLSGNLPARYKNFGEIWNIHKLKNDLYFQSRSYLFKNSGKESTVIEAEGRITCSAKIRESIYVGTTNGMYVLAGNQLIALNGSEHLKDKNICTIVSLGKKNILIGTSFSGLFVFDGKKISPFVSDVEPFICKNQLYSCATNDSLIAFGTVLNGVAITDLEGRNARFINSKNGLQNNTILSMMFDRAGALWLGLDRGIDKVGINSPLSYLYGSTDFRGSGYATEIYNNTLYLGTNQGLYYTEWPVTNGLAPTELNLVNSLLGQVWELKNIDGTLFCTHNRGLFTIKGNTATPVITEDGIWRVRLLRENLAIVGGYSSFYLIEKIGDEWRLKHKIKGFSLNARGFEIDENQQIWLLTDKRACRITLDPTLKKCTMTQIEQNGTTDDILYINKLGKQIVFCGNKGTYIIDSEGKLSEHTTLNNLLGGKALYPIIRKDNNNNIWYITDKRLKACLYNQKTGKYKEKPVSLWEENNFFIAGFESMQLVNNSQAILGNISGFCLVDLSTSIRQQQNNRNEVMIRRVVTTYPKDSLIYGQSYPIMNKEIKLPYQSNSIRIEYNQGPNNDSDTEYSYILKPMDKGWSEWSSTTVKEYTALKEGTYTFQVRSRCGLDEKSASSEFTFTILPPWYRSSWAFLLYAIGFVVLGYFVYRHFRKKIKASWKRLEERKDEELREQEKQFIKESYQKEKEIIKLKNENLEYELKTKSQELANVLLNHLNKNEILNEIKTDLKKIGLEIGENDNETARKKVLLLQSKINRNIEQNIDWKKFEENFDIVNDKFLSKLSEQCPMLNKNERRLCTYIKMGLSSKEIAPLMNLSLRGVEVLRYRMRKKLDFDRSVDFAEFFQKIMQQEIGHNKSD